MMRKNLLHGIDIAAPGGVRKLLDFHRKTFGDAVMEVEPGTNTAGAGEPDGQNSEFKAPATQADLDRIIQDRVARVKNQYADYDDLRSRAERVAELEATNSELTGKVETYEAEKTRAQHVADVAKELKVPASALRGNTREEIEAHGKELLELIKPAGPVVPGQERTPQHIPDSPEREFVGNLFKSE